MNQIVKLFLLVSMLTINCFAPSESSSHTVKTFSKLVGQQGQRAYARSIIQASDRSYVIVGDTIISQIPPKGNCWMLKLKENGEKIWLKMWEGYDHFVVAEETKDRGYIIGGEKLKYSQGGGDARLIKTDENGNHIWEQTFGGEDWSDEIALSVRETQDSGYIAIGETNMLEEGLLVFFMRTNKKGNKLLQKVLDERSACSVGYHILETKERGYILLAIRDAVDREGSDGKVWLIETDANGSQLWDKTFVAGQKKNKAESMQATQDNGYIIAGYTEFDTGQEQAWLIKTDSKGNKLWDRTFGGSGKDMIHCVQQTKDGGFILVGETTSYGAGEEDIWLVKTDSNGNKLWDKTFGGKKKDVAYSVCQSQQGGYVLVGETASFGPGEVNAWIIKTDENGIAPEIGQ